MLIKRKKNFLFFFDNLFVKHWVPFGPKYYCQLRLILALLIWRRIHFEFWQCLFTILSLSPFFYFFYVLFRFFAFISLWKEALLFISVNLNFLHPWMPCAKFIRNWQRSSAISDFLITSMYFCNFIIISLWENAWPFICTNFNLLDPRMLFVKFDLN